MIPSALKRLSWGLIPAFALLAAGALTPEASPARPGEWGLAARPRGPLTLAYIANEGVLLSSGDKKVLIDALFDKPHPDYRAPSPEALDGLMKGTPPFDGVDLLLVTHDHPDHFDAALAARYLAASAGTTLVAPSDAVASLRKAAAAEWGKIEPRVVSLDLKVGEKSARDFSGLAVKAFRTLHSGDRESPMNLIYLFDLEGWRVVHEGDSPGKSEEFARLGLGAEAIDLALVHFWFPLVPDGVRLLRDVLKPAHIALMHYAISDETVWVERAEAIRSSFSDLILLLPGMSARELRK